MKFKDIIDEEKPRERLIKVGVNNLSNEELLSIIIKTGNKDENVKEVSNRILNVYKDIKNLKNATINKLMMIKGIGKVKAIEILASVELGRRVYCYSSKDSVHINTPFKLYDYFKDMFYLEKQELFYGVYLDTKCNLISYKLLFKGTIDKSIVHPRELFVNALYENASFIMIMHNHPSGDCFPSAQDIDTTNKLIQIGNLLNIPVIDHIIIGNNCYYSFYDDMNKNKNNS